MTLPPHMQAELAALGVVPKPRPAQPKTDRTPHDAWWKRGGACPH